jgi:hypothetical protein
VKEKHAKKKKKKNSRARECAGAIILHGLQCCRVCIANGGERGEAEGMHERKKKQKEDVGEEKSRRKRRERERDGWQGAPK